MLEAGSTAPNFKGKINGDREVQLSDYRGNWLVLYFYPKDNTSGCTKEACAFRDSYERLKEVDAEVVGVSPDSIKSHEKFIEKQELNFNLLSDENHKIAEAFGAWGEKSMYGKKYMGIIRSTFIISPEGKISEAYYKVRVSGHVDKVISRLEELLNN